MGRSRAATVVAGLVHSVLAVLAVAVVISLLLAWFGRPSRPATSEAASTRAAATPTPSAAQGRAVASPTPHVTPPDPAGPSARTAVPDARSAPTPSRPPSTAPTARPHPSTPAAGWAIGPYGTASARPGASPGARAEVPRIEVVVLNNTAVSGLAGRTADELRHAGWTVALVGNFVGAIPASTVYYPDGRRADAATLARGLGIDRLRPAYDGVSDTRLTAVLSRGFPSS